MKWKSSMQEENWRWCTWTIITLIIHCFSLFGMNGFLMVKLPIKHLGFETWLHSFSCLDKLLFWHCSSMHRSKYCIKEIHLDKELVQLWYTTIPLQTHSKDIFSVMPGLHFTNNRFWRFFIHVKFVALNCLFILQGAILAAVASRKFPSKITVTEGFT